MSSGIGGRGPSAKIWTLVDLDRNETIEGQFVPQGVTRNVGMVTSSGASLNAPDPFVQFVRGELRTTTFTARIWARDSTEGPLVDDRIRRLEALVERSDDFKRPPVCDFFVGSVETLSMTCVVKSLGGITYDELFDDGSPRGATLQITLEKFVEVELEATDPTKPETFTRRRRAKQGDTYESVALWEYGDAELGVLLRQLNPRVPGMDYADLAVGDEVHIYPEEYLLEQELEPEFHGFKSGSGNEAAEAAVRDLFEARGGSQWLTVFSDSATEDR